MVAHIYYLTVFMSQESGDDLAVSFAQGLRQMQQGVSWWYGLIWDLEASSKLRWLLAKFTSLHM